MLPKTIIRGRRLGLIDERNSKTEIGFLNNYVFVDELRFNINMISHSAHFLRETPAVVTTPSNEATCHNILGIVLAMSVIVIQVKILQTFKRARSLERLKKKTTTIKSASKGTKFDNNLVFISKTLGCMDKVSKMRVLYCRV